MKPHFVGVAGLPRSGSTLLCQLLAEHPEIGCEGHSSPLLDALLGVRRQISDSDFLLSQLDVQFDRTYAHLKSAMQGFLYGWFADCNRPLVVDKNRGWLQAIDFLLHLEPEAKILLSIREPGQIYGSIEAQHQKTIALSFPDDLADQDRFRRADVLFTKDKLVGKPLLDILGLQELSQKVKDRIYVVQFERLVAQPVETMSHVFKWLGVSDFKIDPAKLSVRPNESDSHYRYKYLHRQHDKISIPKQHEIPPRIQASIEQGFGWFYDWFYPEHKRIQP